MGQRKGYKQSEEHKRKISEANKIFFKNHPELCFQKNNDFCRNWKGRKHSLETRRKMAEYRNTYHSTRSEEVKRKISQTKAERGVLRGDKSPNWKGGLTSKNALIRKSKEYKQWRKFVFERDNYTCKECGAKSQTDCAVYLEAHHIKPFAIFIDLRFDINNGITLCEKCHDKKPKGVEIYKIHETSIE